MLERGVILSSSEPDRNSLWLHAKDLLEGLRSADVLEP